MVECQVSLHTIVSAVEHEKSPNPLVCSDRLFSRRRIEVQMFDMLLIDALEVQSAPLGSCVTSLMGRSVTGSNGP